MKYLHVILILPTAPGRAPGFGVLAAMCGIGLLFRGVRRE
jgi:hypothetical protein